MPISPIPELVAELAAGRMVILVDEEDRENEGDLVLAADLVTPEAINFMAKHGRGLICLTLPREHCERLNLPPMTRRNGTQNGYLRPIAYFGSGPIDLKPKRECPVHVFIAVRELGTFLGQDALRKGIRVLISSWRRPHHTMLPTMAKASGHYANSVLAAHEAMDRGFDDAILLNQDGTVACATGHNVFFVKGGVLHTNDESSSIIPGITRDCILAIAREHSVPVQIRAFTREELMRADEVFLTGTAAEVTPVRELDSVSFPTGKKTLGALFQRAYLRAVTGQDDKHPDWLTHLE